MDKKKQFYGTPLFKSLQDQNNEEGTSERSRRANIFNKLQTVRDDQGRQRFHGAFTGGFSAGYFNTVDSVEGFKPKQFISHRGASKKGHGFSHKPEDYMDDEDISEFGIAPKKIRVTNKYNSNEGNPVDKNFLKPASSLGEKILQQINSNLNNKKYLVTDNFQSVKYAPKNDLHGLGYKPLNTNSDSSAMSSLINPLRATLSGKRLKISGEAFGLGVVEDDDDVIGENNAYGYDDISNYDFDRKKTKHYQLNINLNFKKFSDDKYLLKGFVQCSDLDGIQIHNNVLEKYPFPNIPNNWKMPFRAKARVPQDDLTKVDINLELIPRASTSGILDKKFTHAKDLLKSHDIGAKAGLISYSDLKSVGPSTADVTTNESIETEKPAISREKYEWRPCSLLCKHFNVPNPFPDNLFCGIKRSQLVEQNNDLSSKQVNLDESVEKLDQTLAPMDLKRSIYNITFHSDPCTDEKKSNSDILEVDNEDYDCEDEPQVVEITETKCSDRNKTAQDIDEDNEIVLIQATKPEPELIVLSSSSSSRCSSPRSVQDKLDTRATDFDESDSDTYGPPLPPTLKTLIDNQNRHFTSTIDFDKRKSKSKIKR